MGQFKPKRRSMQFLLDFNCVAAQRVNDLETLGFTDAILRKPYGYDDAYRYPCVRSGPPPRAVARSSPPAGISRKVSNLAEHLQWPNAVTRGSCNIRALPRTDRQSWNQRTDRIRPSFPVAIRVNQISEVRPRPPSATGFLSSRPTYRQVLLPKVDVFLRPENHPVHGSRRRISARAKETGKPLDLGGLSGPFSPSKVMNFPGFTPTISKLPTEIAECGREPATGPKTIHAFPAISGILMERDRQPRR